ncbi:hypothetical protein OAH46_01140 [Verrucomicrobia bacterium]|nr:hypothetical protein [Verrucomicrobiota bacterium]
MISEECLGVFDSFLKAKGFTCREVGLINQNYERLRKYRHSEIIAYDGEPLRVDVFIKPINQFKNNGLKTVVYYPDKKIIGWLVFFFSETIGYMPNISCIEFTFDFYTEIRQKLVDLLNSYLLMSHNRSEPNDIDGTFYQTRKPNAKWVKTYIKDKIEKSPVRLELTIKRRIIKELGFELDTLDKYLMEIDFRKHFRFKNFNKEGYVRYFNKKSKERFLENRKNNPRKSRRWWLRKDSLALLETTSRRIIEHWSEDQNCLKRKYGYSEGPAAYISSELKYDGLQYHRFLVALQEMEEVLFSGINGRSFL